MRCMQADVCTAVSHWLFFSCIAELFYCSSSKLKMTLQNGSDTSARSCSSTADQNHSLRWDLTPEEIRHQTQRLIQRIKQAYDSVGSVDIGKVCFENTLQVIGDAKADYAGEWWNNNVHITSM